MFARQWIGTQVACIPLQCTHDLEEFKTPPVAVRNLYRPVSISKHMPIIMHLCSICSYVYAYICVSGWLSIYPFIHPCDSLCVCCYLYHLFISVVSVLCAWVLVFWEQLLGVCASFAAAPGSTASRKQAQYHIVPYTQSTHSEYPLRLSFARNSRGKNSM